MGAGGFRRMPRIYRFCFLKKLYSIYSFCVYNIHVIAVPKPVFTIFPVLLFTDGFNNIALDHARVSDPG